MRRQEFYIHTRIEDYYPHNEAYFQVDVVLASLRHLNCDFKNGLFGIRF